MKYDVPAGMPCRWCGQRHDAQRCPIVKAFEFDADGNITRIEFVTDADAPPPMLPWPYNHPDARSQR